MVMNMPSIKNITLPENITLVPKNYHEKNIGKFKDYKPEFFVGKFVKKTFYDNEDKNKAEHMWVKISKIENNVLIGELDNDPLFLTHIACGDEVEVKLDDIVECISF